VQLISEAATAIGMLRQQGIDVWPVGRTEARTLQLPPGHPQDGLLYVGHPTVPAIYHPAAEFHQRVFEHKFCEAVDLLMALGASKITVKRQEGYTREDARKMDLPLTPTESFGGWFKRSRARDSEILFFATFPGSSPQLPEGLVWFPWERTWQTVARARTEHHTEEFSLVVSYTENYGVDAGLKAKAAGVGLSVGGEFQEQKDTVWQMDGEFRPPATGAVRASQLAPPVRESPQTSPPD
jgi:hypothetical protein